MKYYAVTEDPNELLHYGVKGMKWGQHLFGDDLRPKSVAYHRALGKLKAAFNKTKVQKSISNQQKQQKQNAAKIDREQNKYNEAVKNAQRRVSIVEGLSQMNRDAAYEKAAKRMYNEQRKNEIMELKRQKNFEKNERKMDKYMQEAREGKLKYGRLSDDQVRQITDRLALERSARSLGSAEKTWRQQKKEAFRKGKLSGIERGTAAAMEEVARAGTVYGIKNFMNRKKLNALAKQQGKQEHIKNVAKNKKTNKEIRDEVKQEAYESNIRSGVGFWDRPVGRHMTTAQAAKMIQRNENAEHERIRARNVQDKLANEREESFAKLISDNGYKNEEDAVKDQKKKLEADVKAAKTRFGTKSKQAKDAQKIADDFNKLGKGSDEQRKFMTDYNKKSKETEKKVAESDAVVTYGKIQFAQQQNALNKKENDARRDTYHRLYENWLKSGRKGKAPTPPTYIPYISVPTPSPEELKLFRDLGLSYSPSFYGGGGGGGKKK